MVSIGNADGVDLYDGSQLAIPSLQVPGGASYDAVLITVGQVQSVGGGMPAAGADQYDPATGALSVPIVVDAASGRVYTNVQLTVGSILSVGSSPAGGHPPLVIAKGFESNGTTLTGTSARGTYLTYYGGPAALTGGTGGGYADKGVNPSYEFVYIEPTASQLAANSYTYQGLSVLPPAGQTISATGYNALGFTAQVNPEWLSAAGGHANFVVLVTATVGVGGCSAAAVVSATTSAATAYKLPFAAFTHVENNCGNASITTAAILAGAITQIDFQADGGGAAIAASGLVSNTNTSVLEPEPGRGRELPDDDHGRRHAEPGQQRRGPGARHQRAGRQWRAERCADRVAVGCRGRHVDLLHDRRQHADDVLGALRRPFPGRIEPDGQGDRRRRRLCEQRGQDAHVHAQHRLGYAGLER